MPKVNPSGLEPGMITARSVVNANGMVLLGENTELTAELIDKIKNMNVDSVYIHGTIKPATSREELLAEVNGHFRLVADNPAMNAIKNAIIKHVESLYE